MKRLRVGVVSRTRRLRLPRTLSFFGIGIALILIAAVLAVPSRAQEFLTVEPAQLSAAGQRGESIERTLLLQTAGPTTGLRIIPVDLTSDDGESQFPASAIAVDFESTTLAGNQIADVPVRFDLSGIPAGVYQGALRLVYQGGSRSIPVRISVKDPAWLPLVVLIGGVALGIGVSNYRAKGRPRDLLLVRLGQIRTQMRADQPIQELGKPFRSQIENALTEAEIGLEARQWEDAERAVDEAHTLWPRWRRSRPDWLAQLKAYRRLMENLQTLDTDTPYIAALRQHVEDAYREIPAMESPEAFRNQLEPVIALAHRFIDLQARIETLAGQAATSEAQAEVYREILRTLNPWASDFEQNYADLAEQVEDAILQARQARLLELIGEYQTTSARGNEGERSPFEERLQTLRDAIEALEPGDEAGYVRLLTQISATLELERASRHPATRGAERDLLTTDSTAFIPGDAKAAAAASRRGLRMTLPAVRVKPITEQIRDAGRRLRWFTWVTYAMAVAFLALAGFVELYVTEATFGSQGAGDYFTLLAWGFGSEATRSAIATMIQGWGIIRQ